MKMRLKLQGRDAKKEVVITVSVRTNQAGHSFRLTNFESKREFNKVSDSIHKALADHFHITEIKQVKQPRC